LQLGRAVLILQSRNCRLWLQQILVIQASPKTDQLQGFQLQFVVR
jgi:hypothetical protein